MTKRYWIEPLLPKPSRVHQASYVSGHLLVAALALSLAIGGCSNRKAAQPAAAATPANEPITRGGDWFCQPAVPGAQEAWECVQDSELAADPKPDRLPNADTPSTAKEPVQPQIPNPQLNGQDAPRPQGPPSAAPPPPPDLTRQQGSDPPRPARVARAGLSGPISSKRSATKAAQPTSQRRPLPDYIRLAYQPAEPVSILELPSDYFAVQLTALSSAQRINDFIAEHQLKYLSAAKVIAKGKLSYVLLLGIYDSQDKAEQAVAGDMPEPLERFTPWIRSLSNLKQAMLAAESLDAKNAS